MSHVWFALGIAAMTATTVVLGRLARVRVGWDPLVAIGRAAVQLSVVALLIGGILTVPWTVAGFVLLMLSTASWTSSRRLAGLWRGRRTAALGVLAGSAAALTMVFGLRLVALDTRYVIAVGGILIGASMTASSLAGRNFLRASRAGAEVIEGWLALGATPAQAHDETGRVAARESLLPTLDQSRSTGLVTLPGAFVGALFGGASPLQAAQFQLVVLAGIALCTMVSAVVVTRLAGRTPYVVGGEAPG